MRARQGLRERESFRNSPRRRRATARGGGRWRSSAASVVGGTEKKSAGSNPLVASRALPSPVSAPPGIRAHSHLRRASPPREQIDLHSLSIQKANTKSALVCASVPNVPLDPISLNLLRARPPHYRDLLRKPSRTPSPERVKKKENASVNRRRRRRRRRARPSAAAPRARPGRPARRRPGPAGTVPARRPPPRGCRRPLAPPPSPRARRRRVAPLLRIYK